MKKSMEDLAGAVILYQLYYFDPNPRYRVLMLSAKLEDQKLKKSFESSPLKWKMYKMNNNEGYTLGSLN